MATATRTGYYRWTDINFEWSKTITDPAEQSALKAFLAPDCLTSPQNPLYDHAKGGFELLLGTRQNGEGRLLYSSKQIEYIRYWLHTMALTKKPISLPHSSYLVTSSDFTAISPQLYQTPKELKDAQKMLQKNNKNLKGGDNTTPAMRAQFERARAVYQAKKGTWLAIDFEHWEGSGPFGVPLFLEFGFSQLTWADGEEVIVDGHVCPKDSYHSTRNSQYVRDECENFLYGETKIIPRPEWKELVLTTISNAASRGPLFLVFHDKHGDLKSLGQLGLQLEDIKHELPDKVPETGIFVLDTQGLFRGLCNTNQHSSLSDMCIRLGFNHFSHFHNAGNDAHYTLAALQSMASGAPVDAQRNARWPQYVDPENKTKVNFPSNSESDTDWSEDEGGVDGWLGPDTKRAKTD